VGLQGEAAGAECCSWLLHHQGPSLGKWWSLLISLQPSKLKAEVKMTPNKLWLRGYLVWHRCSVSVCGRGWAGLVHACGHAVASVAVPSLTTSIPAADLIHFTLGLQTEACWARVAAGLEAVAGADQTPARKGLCWLRRHARRIRRVVVVRVNMNMLAEEHAHRHSWWRGLNTRARHRPQEWAWCCWGCRGEQVDQGVRAPACSALCFVGWVRDINSVNALVASVYSAGMWARGLWLTTHTGC